MSSSLKRDIFGAKQGQVSRSLQLFGEIMDLVEETAAVRPEGPMDRARRPAGIGAMREILAAPALGIAAHCQVALDQINLFPILMNERLRREHAGRKA